MKRNSSSQDSSGSSAPPATHRELRASTLRQRYQRIPNSQLNSASVSSPKKASARSSQPSTTFPERTSKKRQESPPFGRKGKLKREKIDDCSQKKTQPVLSEDKLLRFASKLNALVDKDFVLCRINKNTYISTHTKLTGIHRQGLLRRFLYICWKHGYFHAALVAASVDHHPSKNRRLYLKAKFMCPTNIYGMRDLSLPINKAAVYLFRCRALSSMKSLLRFALKMLKPFIVSFDLTYGLAYNISDLTVRDITLELMKYQTMIAPYDYALIEIALKAAVQGDCIKDMKSQMSALISSTFVADLLFGICGMKDKAVSSFVLFKHLLLAGLLNVGTFQMECWFCCWKPSSLFSQIIWHYIYRFCGDSLNQYLVRQLLELVLNQGLAPMGSDVEGCRKLSEWLPRTLQHFQPYNLFVTPFVLTVVYHRVKAMRQLYDAGVTTPAELQQLRQMLEKNGLRSFLCCCRRDALRDRFSRGVLPTHRRCLARIQAAIDFINEVSAKPRSLKSMAMLTVRRHLKFVTAEEHRQAVDQLHLPVSLKQFVYPAYQKEGDERGDLVLLERGGFDHWSWNMG